MAGRLARWTLDVRDVAVIARFRAAVPFVVLAGPEGDELCVLWRAPDG
jgi:hypothetical protein